MVKPIRVAEKKPVKVDEKTIFQKLLPGALFIIITTILGLSVKAVVNCSLECVLGGIGIGTTGITMLYIIGRGLKDYGVF